VHSDLIVLQVRRLPPPLSNGFRSPSLPSQRLYHELTKRRSAFDSIDSGFGADDKSRATSRPTTKDKIFLDGIRFKGEFLKTGALLRFFPLLVLSPHPDSLLLGDWIHLLNPDDPSKPVIGQIWKTYKRNE
jgi:hypothetical protein